MLQLEVFLRHVEGLTASPADISAAPSATDDPAAPMADNGGDEDPPSEVQGMPESLGLGLSLLQEHKERIYAAGVGEVDERASPEAIGLISHLLRLAEWTSALMLWAGPVGMPDDCVMLLQNVLRKAAKWMGRTLPAPRTASSGLAAAGATWVGAHQLLALRALLVSFAALATDNRGSRRGEWEEKFPAWPETLYVGMASGPQTLVEGVQLLCQVLVSAKQTQIKERRASRAGSRLLQGSLGITRAMVSGQQMGCERPPSAAALHLARWRTRWIWSSKALPMGWQCLAGCWRGESTWNPRQRKPCGQRGKDGSALRLGLSRSRP